MIDTHSKRLLAIWLSFKSPSKRACGMVVRMCVRNHGRLPNAIIVDRGSDFESVYFQSLLAHFGIDHVSRPKSHPRYGSEIERLFGIFKTKWLAMRPGNTVAYHESRSVSSSHSSQKTAQLRLEDLWLELCQFMEWYNDVIVGNEETSPKIKMDDALVKMPFLGVKVEFNDRFLLQSAVDSGNYIVDPSRGIHIDGIHYWAPDLTAYAKKHSRVHVRHEPENPYLIYANIENNWISCYASRYKTFCTEDPVVRLAHSIRTLDGRAVRDAAKDEANQNLVDLITSNDKNLHANANSESNVKDRPEKPDSNQYSPPAVEDMKTVEVVDIEEEEWEV